jgi:anti-anti-sigma regulatory factor
MSETHFFSQDYSILVVNLVGVINQETSPILQECQREICKSNSKWIILNFRDISQEGVQSMIPILVELQKIIRQKPVTLRFSGLHPDLRTLLVQEKAISEEDLFNNLADALKITSSFSKQVA